MTKKTNTRTRRKTDGTDICNFGVNIRTTAIVSQGNATTNTTTDNDLSDIGVCNCLSCGKIYDCRGLVHTSQVRLIQSGGVCSFCGSLVPRIAERLQGIPCIPASDTGEAYELKDRLVEYDRDSASRTQVIDDQNEYYDILQANAWLSDEERQEMMNVMEQEEGEQHGASRALVVTFDVFGRRSAAPSCILVDGEEGEEEKDKTLLQVAQERAMAERPYGGGRSVVGPDAACCHVSSTSSFQASSMRNTNSNKKGPSQSFLEDFSKSYLSQLLHQHHPSSRSTK